MGIILNKRNQKWKNKSPSSTYNSWNSMRSRCYRQKDQCYHLYGGRGIKICDRWLNDYDAFFEDMGEKPYGLSLDRIDSNGNYEPTNCRWVSMKVQQNNRTNNFRIEFEGESHTLAEWSEIKGLKADTLRKRIDRNIPIERALNPQSMNLPKHGTNRGYSFYKCKCVECKAFARTKRIKGAIRLKTIGILKPIQDKYHGTRTGYECYKCKCLLCKESNKERSFKQRHKAKQNKEYTK